MSLNLGLGLGLTNKSGGTKPDNPLCDAIAQKRRVTAREGNATILFAPHIVYIRGTDPRVTGRLVEENGETPKKDWVTYKVSDLTEIALAESSFEPDARFDPDDPQFGGEIVCKISL